MTCNHAMCQSEADVKYYCPICNSHFCSEAHLTEHNVGYGVTQADLDLFAARQKTVKAE